MSKHLGFSHSQMPYYYGYTFSSLSIQPFFCSLPLPSPSGAVTGVTAGYWPSWIQGSEAVPFSTSFLSGLDDLQGLPLCVPQEWVSLPHLVSFLHAPNPHTFSTPGPWMSGLRAFGLHVTSILSFSSTYVLSSLSSALADNLSHSPEWP